MSDVRSQRKCVQGARTACTHFVYGCRYGIDLVNRMYGRRPMYGSTYPWYSRRFRVTTSRRRVSATEQHWCCYTCVLGCIFLYIRYPMMLYEIIPIWMFVYPLSHDVRRNHYDMEVRISVIHFV